MNALGAQHLWQQTLQKMLSTTQQTLDTSGDSGSETVTEQPMPQHSQTNY